MPNCVVCYLSHETLIGLPCGCSFCSECIIIWIQSQTTAIQFAKNIRLGGVPCLSEQCKKRFEPHSLLSQFNDLQKVIVEDALIKEYLENTSDIRMCPSPNCHYAGVFDSRIKCSVSLECALCLHQWKDASQLNAFNKLVSSSRNEIPSLGDVLCNIWKQIFTKHCPQCNARISKDGGCSWVTCTICLNEFCWRCRHPNFEHNINLCLITTILRFAMIGGLMLCLLMKAGFMPLLLLVAAEIIFINFLVFGGIFIVSWTFLGVVPIVALFDLFELFPSLLSLEPINLKTIIDLLDYTPLIPFWVMTSFVLSAGMWGRFLERGSLRLKKIMNYIHVMTVCYSLLVHLKIITVPSVAVVLWGWIAG